MIQGIFRVIFTLTYNALLEMNLFTPRASRYSTIPYDSIVEYASKAAGITENDMRLTMEALMEAFSYYLCNGHSFKIDGVGTFSLCQYQDGRPYQSRLPRGRRRCGASEGEFLA